MFWRRTAFNTIVRRSVGKPAPPPTIFERIVKGEIPAKIVFEDESCMAFHDVDPKAPVHVLVIPKALNGLTQLQHAQPHHVPLLGHLLFTASQVAKQLGLGDNGYRLVINDGGWGGQSVYHLHLHILGGRPMNWPPG